MIIRIFREVVQDGRREEPEDFFRNTAILLMQDLPGLKEVLPGLPQPEKQDEFCMDMVWDSVESLAAFSGENWREPRLHEDVATLVKGRFLHHYDLIA